MDVQVVLASDRCEKVAEFWANDVSHDVAQLTLNFRDIDDAVKRLIRFAKQNPIEGIVPTDELTAVIAAHACASLGLRHNPSEAVMAAGNKLQFRRRLQAAGLSTPRCHPVDVGDVEASLAAARIIGFPVIVKPIHLSASRGVIRANDERELEVACLKVAELLKDPAVRARDPDASRLSLVESYVPGPEVAFEGILDAGRLTQIALFDKPEPLDGPVFAETIYVTPSILPPATRRAIHSAVSDAALAIKLREGPVHAELRLGTATPMVIELAARSIGGLCSRSLRAGAGASLERIVISHAIGRPIEPRRVIDYSGVAMLPVREPGILKAIRGENDARSVPGVQEVTITARVGDRLVSLPEGNTYLGFCFARGPTSISVIQALQRARSKLCFDVASVVV